MKGLVLLFPGIRYTVDMPLLYYPGWYYRQQGYEVVPVSYGSQFDQVEFHNQDITAEIEAAKQYCFPQLQAVDYASYETVIFVSKSLGTVVAGWAQQALHIVCQQIYLTPIHQTLPYLDRGCMVIAGNEDKVLDPAILRAYCQAHAIEYHGFPGGHRIEVKQDISTNLKTIDAIIALLKK